MAKEGKVFDKKKPLQLFLYTHEGTEMGCRCTLMENLLSGLSGYCRDLWLISGSRSSKPTENYFFVEESNLLMDMVSVGLD